MRSLTDAVIDEIIDAAQWVARAGLASALAVVFLIFSAVVGALMIGIQYVPPTASFNVALNKGVGMLVPAFETTALVPNTFFGALFAGFIGGVCAKAVYRKFTDYFPQL